MGGAFLIRRVRRAELPACLDVIHKSFSTVADEFGLTAENAPTNGAFMPLERLIGDFDSKARMYGAFLDGRLAGFMQLVISDERCELEKLCVPPEFRHLGVGAQLGARARRSARRLGAKRIDIGIIEENARLKSWYLAQGFSHTGTKKFPHLPFTVGFMTMELNHSPSK